MSEKPEDIAKADGCIPVGLDGNHYRSTLRHYIAAAIAAERVTEREACAKLAETAAIAGRLGVGIDIAAAIRSQP